MRHSTVHVNGIDLGVRAMGDASAPLMLFLHGFPEYSGAWDEVLPAFAGSFHAVAPDQRGYAGSSKPEGLEAYRVKELVRDVLGLGERFSPGRPFVLVAHDWGASVAYATAMAAPARIARLVIINGVHPGPFQRALLEDDAQRQASSYMHYLRDPRAEERLSANNFEKLMGMLVRFGPQPWLTPEKRAGYLEAWSPPGALTGMLNWYRASPLLVPKPGEAIDPASQPLKLDPARFRVRMPHLVIWGMDDRALLPVTRATLPDYCDDLTVREIPGADHWVVHQRTDEVIGSHPRLHRGRQSLIEIAISNSEPILAGTGLPVAAVVHACHERTIDAGLADLAVPGLDRNEPRADPHLLRRAALRGGPGHVSRLPTPDRVAGRRDLRRVRRAPRRDRLHRLAHAPHGDGHSQRSPHRAWSISPRPGPARNIGSGRAASCASCASASAAPAAPARRPRAWARRRR